MKKKLLCPLIAMSVLVFSGCDDGGNSSASEFQETTVTTVTTEPVVTDSDGNTVIEFEKSFLYSEDADKQPYSFLFENIKKSENEQDLGNGISFLVENLGQLGVLNYTYENEYTENGVKYTWNSSETAEKIQKKYDDIKEKIFETYDDDFFKENSLVFFVKLLGSLPNKNVEVEKVYKNNGVLTLYIHNYEPGDSDAMDSYCGVIELKKDDIKDIIDVKMEYEFEIYSDGE
ncbi:MAG: hypothetical protein LBL93_05025 [Ruminococcus sp.]|nr:hypothetical protein [Ruminococcus sp.]